MEGTGGPHFCLETNFKLKKKSDFRRPWKSSLQFELTLMNFSVLCLTFDSMGSLLFCFPPATRRKTQNSAGSCCAPSCRQRCFSGTKLLNVFVVS